MSEPQPDSRRCAVCGKPQDPAVRPFCSKRCAHLDLARWLNGDYAIPSDAPIESLQDGEE